MFKKGSALLLAIIMILSFSAISYAADNGIMDEEEINTASEMEEFDGEYQPKEEAIGSTAERAEIESVAEQYLSAASRNMWLYESNDLSEGTLSGYLAASPTTRAAFLDDPVAGVSEAELLKYEAGISFVENKVEYFKNMRKSQNIQRNEFSMEYSLVDVDSTETTAKVEMIEYISFRYPDFPDVLSEVFSVYTVDLVNINGGWLVADVTEENGPFDREYKDVGFDASNPEASFRKVDAELAAYEAELDNSIIPVEYAPSDTELAELASNSVLYTYNGQNAAAYAYTYATSKYNHVSEPTPAQQADARSYWNENYWKDNTNDCMNFASQSIWAGFGGSNEKIKIYNSAAGTHSAPMDTTGAWTWYGTTRGSADATKTPTWTSCKYFRNYVKGEANTQLPDFYATYDTISGSDGFASVVSSKDKLVGAVLHVNSLQHAVVVTDVNGYGRNQVLFTAHTYDRKGVKVSEYHGSGEIVVIIPEKVRVYNPDPVRITATLRRPVAAGSTLSLKSSASTACSTLTMKVTKGSSTIASATVSNKTDVTKSVTFSTAGLYTVTTTGKKTASSTPVTYVYTIRVY